MNTLHYLRENGVINSSFYARERLSEDWHERRLGIDTGKIPVELSEFGIQNKEMIHYYPVPYAAFNKVIQKISIDKNDVFIDFGCGKGRVVVLAAGLSIENVIGVDLVKEFTDSAKDNLNHSTRHHRCKKHEILTVDVLEYDIPDNATIFHFYNPFLGDILDTVLDNIRKSLTRSPREATILFANPVDFERAIKGRDWIKFDEEIPYPHYPGKNPLTQVYRIYRVTPPEQGDG